MLSVFRDCHFHGLLEKVDGFCPRRRQWRGFLLQRLPCAVPPAENRKRMRTNRDERVVHFWPFFRVSDCYFGGEGGIRTRVRVISPQTAFEAAPLRPLRYLSEVGSLGEKFGCRSKLTCVSL